MLLLLLLLLLLLPLLAVLLMMWKLLVVVKVCFRVMLCYFPLPTPRVVHAEGMN